mgnify:CR=1 FL=1
MVNGEVLPKWSESVNISDPLNELDGLKKMDVVNPSDCVYVHDDVKSDVASNAVLGEKSIEFVNSVLDENE